MANVMRPCIEAIVARRVTARRTLVHADDFTTFDFEPDRLLGLERGLANDMPNVKGSGDLRPGEFAPDDVAPPGSAIPDEPVTLEAALAMNREYFEALVAVLYARRGHEAYGTPSTKDNGVDVVALPRTTGKGRLVQAKTSGTEDAALDRDAVKEVVAGHAFHANQFPDVTIPRVCMTNQYFDQQARLDAALDDVELVEQPKLAGMPGQTTVNTLEVEQVPDAEWTEG